MTSLKVSVHPGEILRHEFLEPMDLTPIRLARHIHVPRTRIERLIKEETSMTIDTAKRLARAFGTSVEFWMNLQMSYDLLKAEADIDVSDIKPLAAA